MSGTFDLTQVELSIEGGVAHGVDLEKLHFRHGISGLYQLDLVVVAKHDIELDDKVGSDARIKLNGVPGWSFPELHGVLWRVRLLGLGDSGRARYAICLVPPAKLATQRRDHRIFQDISVPEIIATVLASHKRVPRIASHLVEPHAKREFVVQYGESDLTFLERIAADEGIAIAHDPRRGGQPALFDDTAALSRSDVLTLQCTYNAGLVFDGVPRIRDVEVSQEVRTARVVVGDYDYSKPRYLLAAEAESTSAAHSEEDLEDYSFEVGRFAVEHDGEMRAKRLLEGRRVGSRVLTGLVDYPVLAGQIVGIAGHRRDKIDGDYLVIESEFCVLRSEACRASIRAIPANTSYRPRRLPRPRIAGTQTATVVGAPGETVDVDSEGRVEVAFHWDRRRPTGLGASRRVRVAQAWAGAGYGVVTAPRVGDEVVVTFVDGDPDEPLIVGQVHNGVRPSALSLPASKTQTVWRSQSVGSEDLGFNQILMDDAMGAERLELRAERDFVSKTLRNDTTTIGSSSSRSVGGSQRVAVGASSSCMVGADASLSVCGSRQVAVEGDQHMVVKELAEYRAKHMQFAVEEDLVAMSDTMDLISNARTDETTDGEHVIKNKQLLLSSDESVFVHTKTVQFLASESFTALVGAYILRMDSSGVVLSGPGSSISLSADGISLVTAGVVDIQGALVKINS